MHQSAATLWRAFSVRISVRITSATESGSLPSIASCSAFFMKGSSSLATSDSSDRMPSWRARVAKSTINRRRSAGSHLRPWGGSP